MCQRTSDQQLLREYCETRSEPAFTELASRHAGLVYSAARRQLRDSHLAEDATQLVFLALARKARTLADHPVLSAWLLQATTFECRNLLKSKERQSRKIQQLASMQHRESEPGAAAEAGHGALWQSLSPHVDAALAHLREPERMVIVLRFFEHKSHSEAARVLGISEESVRQRASRAIARLRRYLRQLGIETTGDALTMAIAAGAVRPPPPGAIQAAASAGARHAAGALSTAKGASILMAITKTQLAAGLGTIAVLATAAAVYNLHTSGTSGIVVSGPNPPQISQGAPVVGNVSGTLLGPDGNPVAGARIQVGTARDKASVYKIAGRPLDQTDQNGRFAVRVPAQKAVLIFTSETGCALVTAGQFAGGNVTLQPWGHVRGTLRNGSKPLADVTLHLWHWDRSDCFNSLDELTTRTDSQGHFQFDRVQPSADVSLSYPRPGGQYMAYLDVVPAQTTTVVLGGAGRDVVGKAGPVVGSNPPIGWKPTRTRSSHAQLWYLEGPAFTPAYHKRPMALFNVLPDGSFRLSDLPPGKYRAELRLLDEPLAGRWVPPAMAVATFSVENASELTEIDLGTIPTRPSGQ